MQKQSSKIKKLLCMLLSGALAVSMTPAVSLDAKAVEADSDKVETISEPQAQQKDYGLADNIQDGVILHCFDWMYTDITEELPRIAEAGFTSIQISPVQNPIPWGYDIPWYLAYQPYDLAIVADDDTHNKEALETLCKEADKYGIKIIMDVIANHLVIDIEADYFKEEYEDYYKYVFPEEFLSKDCWHEKMDIKNYKNRYYITNGRLGMPDLNTENPVVQQRALNFIKELKEAGVDGIRWDAAKHIALPSEGSDFWKVVTDTGLYNYGEILTGPTDDDKHDELMAEYAEYMSVTDSKYGETLRGMFFRGEATVKDGNWTHRGVSADKLVYWGESHDTYSNNGAYGGTNALSQNIIDRAYAVAAARADATSLYFSRPSSTVKDEILLGEKGSMHFQYPQVSAVNHFHNAMIGKKDCYAASENCAVVTRENGGAVIVCCSGNGGEVTVENAGGYAKPGTYKDEVSGNTFVITEKTITGKVGSSGIAVVYNSPYEFSKVFAEAEVNRDIIFGETKITMHCIDVDNVYYTLEEVYRGETVSKVKMDYTDGNVLTIGKDAPFNTHFILTLYGTTPSGKEISVQYKYNVYDKEGRVLDYSVYKKGGIVFDNFSSEWKDVYVYAYSESGNEKIENSAYPGVKMNDIGKEYFEYKLPDTFKDCKKINVVFSNSKGEKISSMQRYGYENEIYEEPLTMSGISYGVYIKSYWQTPDFTFTYNKVLYGDFDEDGEITSADSLSVLRKSVGLDNGEDYPPYYDLVIADIDDDEVLTSADALEILRYSVGLLKDSKIGKRIVED